MGHRSRMEKGGSLEIKAWEVSEQGIGSGGSHPPVPLYLLAPHRSPDLEQSLPWKAVLF